jgi:hypothetical protein
LGTHNPFTDSTTYIFTVLYVEDLAGNPLTTGPIPNPWSWFTVDLTSPHIVSTNPPSGAVDVPQDEVLNLTFSEPINTTSFSFTILPDPSNWTWTWNSNFTSVEGRHSNFTTSTSYNFTVLTANDIAGNPLGAGPVSNPWNWTTIPDLIAPTIVSVQPAHLDFDVALNQDVFIMFSESIDLITFTYAITPDPGGWIWTWNAANTTVTGTHINFTGSTSYNFSVIKADDVAGNQLETGAVANPWNWTTRDVTPGSISGRVLDENNDAVDSATITLRDSVGGTLEIATTDVNGDFMFINVIPLPAEYSVTAEKTGYYQNISENIDVVTGQNTFILLMLEANATVRGTVVDENFNPISGVNVKLLDENNIVISVSTTNLNGNFELTGIDYGIYRLKITAFGYAILITSECTIDKSILLVDYAVIKLTPFSQDNTPPTISKLQPANGSVINMSRSEFHRSDRNRHQQHNLED